MGTPIPMHIYGRYGDHFIDLGTPAYMNGVSITQRGVFENSTPTGCNYLTLMSVLEHLTLDVLHAIGCSEIVLRNSYLTTAKEKCTTKLQSSIWYMYMLFVFDI